MSTLSFFPLPLSLKEEHKQLELMRQGNKSARNKLIEHNLRLVAHVIKKYYTTNINDQNDLVSIGTIGLIRAIDTFNMDKGIRLSSYAARCIENEILMFFRNVRKSAKKTSLDDPIDTDKNGNNLTLLDIMSTDDDIVENLDIKFKSEKLYSYIKSALSSRERTIIESRYGLYSKPVLTQKEVSKRLNISRSYVSRIEKKALILLKKEFLKIKS
jgi:RNA polymerase sporulation-specific sigma factor